MVQDADIPRQVISRQPSNTELNGEVRGFSEANSPQSPIT